MVSTQRLKTGLVFDFYPTYKLASQPATVLWIASWSESKDIVGCSTEAVTRIRLVFIPLVPLPVDMQYTQIDAGHVREYGTRGKPCVLTNQSITSVLCLKDSGER